MFRRLKEKDPRADAALREQMLSLFAPEPSADFDARVRNQVLYRQDAKDANDANNSRGSEPGTRNSELWTSLRPALSAAAASLLLTLALLQGLSMAPSVRVGPSSGPSTAGRIASIGGAELRLEMATLGVGR